MTDRERELIGFYLPSPPDPELGSQEFYMLDSADRVIKVWFSSIGYSGEDGEIRLIRRVGSNSGVFNASGECGDFPGWYYPWALYDNKEDCRNHTHTLYNNWEHLRDLQEERQ